MNNIRWQMLKRDSLPEVLFGYAQKKIGSPYIHRVQLDDKMIAVGGTETNQDASYNPPAVIVIGDSSISEAFSWLKVYAPQTSPLSQFARVISIADFDAYFESSGREDIASQHSDRWASIVLGEVLSQGEADIELDAIPLSRASACFSTSVARSTIIYGNSNASTSCIERLKKLEADKRFVRRSVSVDDLLPIWRIMFARIETNSIDIIAEAIIETARKLTLDVAPTRLVLPELKEYPLLQSNSIEERTITYKKLASEVMLNCADGHCSPYSSALLAVAAFLVGRGTTHSFLLRPLSRRLPSVFTWFGLIAALAGPKSWDADWSRASKGIERQLRTKLDWSEPSLADLCWEEYQWLAGTIDGAEAFSALPKMLPKVLSIEVIPGAMCQLRLSSSSESNVNEFDGRKSPEQSQRDAALQTALTQMTNIAQKALLLLDKQQTPTQQSLVLENIDSVQSKGSRAKRSKRNDN